MVSAWLVALALMLAAPAAGATALPERPIKKTGFRLLARASGSLKVNQVQCGLISNGQICVDSTGSSTIPGSVWPKGTNNQYTFNSGISLAGIVGSEMPAWQGDTIGAFFFEGSGFLLNGEQVEPIYNASDAADLGQWPEFAKVPGVGDSVSAIYDPLLQNQISASQGDVYFLTWDGNPARVNGRIHPMGVVVETRGLAWNYPAGNQDIIYFIYTIYNVSSVAPEDYVNIRPALRDRLLQQAQQFQASNEAAFGVDIPEHGYTLQDVFMNFGADQDVTVDAGADYATFNNLFNLAITYHEKFAPQPGNTFDPGIHAPPFLPAPGFVGTKYLRSPILADGTESGTVLAGLTTNRGAFPDPNNAQQLYRYISGNLNPAAGDPQCNTGDPKVTHLCFINTVPSDTRTFQSSGPLTLPAGGQSTIVVAYIFAPPVATGKCPSAPCPVTMTPDPLLIANATVDNPGVDAIDSAMGYRGYTGEVSQDSTRTVPNSLLDKAKVAQNIFDSKFLLPFAPIAPTFYLVPGDNAVTVLWQPSTSEAQGDAYFAIANDPLSGARYDPAYRQFDVEGYRIYRGRVDTPSELELVAQFDYDTTQMFDFQGTINPNDTCAPELGINTGCAGPFPTTPPVPPARFTDSVGVDLVGPIVQVRPGNRVELTNGTVRVNNGPNAVDTLVTGGNTGFPELANTGVPFAYTDDGTGLLSAPRNNVRYFYAVTAFDVNSFVSGPASLESQRAARAVVPTHQASNVATAQLTSTLTGDDGEPLDPAGTTFTIDPETGKFNGPPPPTGAGQLEAAFAPLIPTLLPALSLTATIDSVLPRSVECGALGNFRGFCAEFFVTFDKDGTTQKFRTITAWPFWASSATGEASATAQAQLGALPVQPDPTSAARYGIPAGAASFNAAVQVTTVENIRSSAQENQQARRLLANVSPGGSRWFSGANESVNDPAYSIRVGHVDGVDSIWTPLSHTDQDPVTVGVQEPAAEDACMQLPPHFFADMGRQADIELTWGDGGAIASVRDITHHLDVPFHGVPQAGWGFVTDNNGNGKIDWVDFIHTPGVEQAVHTFDGAGFCAGLEAIPAVPGTPLTQTATVTPVSFTADAGGAEAPGNFVTAGNGFGLYINGQQFIFALTGGALPAAGTKWTLRAYWGVVTASANAATTDPSGYTYTAAPGSPALPGLKINFSVTAPTGIAAATKEGLSAVHTVPDPYYVTNSFETTTTDKIIRFVNLPAKAIIRIYSSSGVLVRVLEHNSEHRGASDEDVSTLGGEETWDVRNRNNQVVASGVYFYHIESGDARRVGRFTVVNFAQ
ncbi:MAG TPA: hypothetical protein VJQ44_15320 [Gemmatimonadales bacterium]|nr:hypothetical protein [Gemmatimonadales bacterium]